MYESEEQRKAQEAKKRAEHRRGGVALSRCVPDSVIHGTLIDTEIEHTYRRGYHQGFSMALLHLGEGHSIEELEAFAEGKLRDWRRVGYPYPKGTTIKAISPPEPPAKKRRGKAKS